MTSSRARVSQQKALNERKSDAGELFGIVKDLADIKADLVTLTAAVATIDSIVDDIKATLDTHVGP